MEDPSFNVERDIKALTHAQKISYLARTIASRGMALPEHGRPTRSAEEFDQLIETEVDESGWKEITYEEVFEALARLHEECIYMGGTRDAIFSTLANEFGVKYEGRQDERLCNSLSEESKNSYSALNIDVLKNKLPGDRMFVPVPAPVYYRGSGTEFFPLPYPNELQTAAEIVSACKKYGCNVSVIKTQKPGKSPKFLITVL